MYRILFVLPLLACTVQPINQQEKNTEEEEENLYPDGYQFGDLVIDPGSLDFGNVELDATKTEELIFINTGTSTLSIVSASIDGDSAFTLESSFLNFDLEPEGEEIVNVRFAPLQDTDYEASLSVLISTESSAGEVLITGLGGDAEGTEEPSGEPAEEPVEGGLELDKTNHNYGQISLNSTATLIINVTNPTEEPITVTGVSSTDSSFSISPYSNVQEGEAISAGITRTMTINFNPTEEIMYEGTLTLETDSAEAPEIDIDLSGEGIYQCSVCTAKLQVNGLSSNPMTVNSFQVGLDFNTFQTYPNPAVLPFTISNGGDEPLEISSITIMNDAGLPALPLCGTDGTFTIPTSSTPMVLDPFDAATGTADSITLDITFTYSGSDFFCGESSLLDPSMLTIMSNDPTNPTFQVNLEATVFAAF
jgi:hypothetical protein